MGVLYTHIRNGWIKMFNNILFLDSVIRFQTTFQDIANPSMYGVYVLHGFIFQYLILIVILVGGLLYNVIIKFTADKNPISLKYFNYSVSLELF
jgi:heme/copper-type cytochrome/quinol oxidase subunit 2